MNAKIHRETVDLSGFPDLVVIYRGMRVRTLKGIKTLLGFGPKIDQAGAQRPEGLLHFENNIIFSISPLHIGMRWYWKDFESMEQWAHSDPHRLWWQAFLRDTGGTGFWHEVYSMRGGMEALYSDIELPLGFLGFAPSLEARGAKFSARDRLGKGGATPVQPQGTSEQDLY